MPVRAPITAERRQGIILVAFLVIQTLAAVFYIGDVFGDLAGHGVSAHLVVEALVTLALVLAIGFGAIRLRRTLDVLRAQEAALEVARGALGEVIDGQFGAWGLTPAERDVGMLALKGLDVAEIAEVRGAAQGTVRAQLTRIYSKAGVSGRAQFAAFFVEDLMGAGLHAKPAE
ncbi:helix-turn-helix transcriptional regulator [Rhodobacter sp. Har01]|uniref:helix-turn-helix transcriptional regulator n=1 Tax=Rhodobacter sp. Har01 TaxID=2883999 RepID=UPI001D06CB81|nr:helix-turn-helix transcriptional regulator [Rhodobacter sp. Har01]MCB6178756.1 helix-turn-helix transcriptional regulator [Rhodobacter sp. Har01]